MSNANDLKIAALAQTGASNREIAAVLGRALTSSEQIQIDRARALTRIKRAVSKSNGAKAGADRVSEFKSRNSMVSLPSLTDEQQAERERLEADPRAWLKFFLAEVYTKPFAKLHDELIDRSIEASRGGGRFCVAGERGIGKSAILMGLILYLVFKGEQEFPICLPWDAKALKRAFRFWRAALCFNMRLMEYYPEFCAPFQHSRGISQKLTATW